MRSSRRCVNRRCANLPQIGLTLIGHGLPLVFRRASLRMGYQRTKAQEVGGVKALCEGKASPPWHQGWVRAMVSVRALTMVSNDARSGLSRRYLKGDDCNMTELNDRPTALTAGIIEQAARSRLGESGYRALKAVTCRFREGDLVLFGRVPTYHHKQVAQESVRTLRGVVMIVNRIEVLHASGSTDPRSSRA